MLDCLIKISYFKVDTDSRIESTWYAGGMNPPESVKRSHRAIEWKKDYENDPINRVMVYHGFPSATVRSQLPLNPVVPFSEAENPDLAVPFFQYDPRVLGIETEYRPIANIPGKV